MVCATLLGAGCGELRAPDTSEQRVTYVDHVRPLLQARCVGCHGGSSPAGSYDLTSYRGLLGPGTDTTRNVVPGDAQSRLLTKLDPSGEPAHYKHLLPRAGELGADHTEQDASARRDADLARLKAWVTEDRLAYAASSVHPPTWAYPGKRNAADFHGGALRTAKWDLTGCRKCHGGSLQGDAQSGAVACTTCHPRGVDACTTCHGSASTLHGSGTAAPPADLSWNLVSSAPGVGAHAAHAGSSPLFAAVACSDCHKVPSSTGAAGHLFDDAAGTTTDLTAEVALGGTAVLGGVSAAYSRTDRTCTVYCHGAGLSDKGSASTPAWTADLTLTCASCHAAPHAAPAYGGADCTVCHQQVVHDCPTGSATCYAVGSGPKMSFVSSSLHGDGKVLLGKAGATGTCDGCHGTAASSGAPAPDLQGNTSSSSVTVGLHATHLQGGALTGVKVSCATCHKVPATLKAAGHIDSDAPAEVTWGDQATGKARSSGLDLKPAWDRSAGTCKNVYCHALDGGKVSTWTWTATASPSLGCDACHGLPPATTVSGGTHPSATTCNTCHSSAYAAGGGLDPTKHINGRVDL